ncbi:MAG: pilus assembly protein [Elusimicrobia bacterium]|nr:pilus assembly protein [Elusimicrobiota bacterium]
MRSLGQVIVEVLLVLPWFLMIVFTILEMGNIAFHMILINHATWETARYGAMIASPKGGSKFGGCPSANQAMMDIFIKRILPGARVAGAFSEPTTPDNQASPITGCDLVLTSEYPIPLIFPISNFALSKPPGTGKRIVLIPLRMPIEQPLFK